jgi:hypothetical protein
VDGVAWEVDGVAALDRLGPHLRVRRDVVGDVGDVHPEDVLVVALLDGDGVVEVLGVDGVRRPGRQFPEVLALAGLRGDLGLDVRHASLGLIDDRRRQRVVEVELLQELLALALDVAGEFGVDLHGALPLDGARLGLRLAVAHGHSYGPSGS